MKFFSNILFALLLPTILFTILKCNVKGNKEDCVKLNNLGVKFQQVYKFDSAEIYFNKAINIDSTNKTPYINLIDLYLRIKKYNSALSLMNRFLRLSNLSSFDKISIDLNKGIAYYCIGKSDSATVHWTRYDNFYKIKAEQSSKFEDHFQRIPVLIWLGKNSEAIELGDALKKQYPDKSQIINEMINNPFEMLQCK